MSMFHTVLVANRGEIAVRVIRTLRELGIRSVAVHSDADTNARHVRAADLAVRIGPAPARQSYLNIDAIIAAARSVGAQAIHPGYGFLSENVGFARACAAAGLVLIGPPVAAMATMGDKISAKGAVRAAGVPVVPGRFEPAMTDPELTLAAAEVGYPVLVKPAAGGGGKGMRLVRAPAELAAALVSARRESLSSFGDETLFVERLILRPRHIEVQILADSHGTVIHLGERECSLQRRHQKIIEEAPSVLLDPPTRQRIGLAAVEIARTVGYLGVGTVEFIVSADAPQEFFFLEMNTRLQVEHPVTEMVTGLDLVAEQVRVAAGQPLRLTQADVQLTGHAIEARLYAEDPARGFLPTGGTVLALREPTGAHLRFDSGIDVGSEIGSHYDPMLAKLIAWGPDRAAALTRLRAALAGTAILGVGTNVDFLAELLADPEVEAGRLDTELVDRELPRLLAAAADRVPDPTGPQVADALAVYGLIQLLQLQPAPTAITDLWAVPSGWRVGGARPLRLLVESAGTRAIRPHPGDPPGDPTDGQPVGQPGRQLGAEPVEVLVQGTPHEAEVTVGLGPAWSARVRIVDACARGPAAEHAARHGATDHGAPARAAEMLVTVAGVTRRWLHAVDRDRLWLSCAGQTWVLAAARPQLREQAAGPGNAELRSPMPGVVLAVRVKAGDQVVAGEPLIVVEAMKMEHAVCAVRPGWVDEVLVTTGDQVGLDQPLVIVRSADPQ